jgi:hypothetical protein
MVAWQCRRSKSCEFALKQVGEPHAVGDNRQGWIGRSASGKYRSPAYVQVENAMHSAVAVHHPVVRRIVHVRRPHVLELIVYALYPALSILYKLQIESNLPEAGFRKCLAQNSSEPLHGVSRQLGELPPHIGLADSKRVRIPSESVLVRE